MPRPTPTSTGSTLLKDCLPTIFKLSVHEAAGALDSWIAWARRSRVDSFAQLQRRINTHRHEILASIEYGCPTD